MIPLAAVARPRQGIRLPAAGAPALSAGSIIATAGDGQVTVTETAAPQNGSGTITRTLYRSTTAGQLGTSVGAVTLPYNDTQRQNGTTLYYTVRYADEAAQTADSNQAGATPGSPATGATLLYGHNFDDNTLGDFSQWGGYTPEPASVIDDPTGSGRGKVCKIVYVRPASSSGSRDVNSIIGYSPKIPGGHSRGPTWGDRIYWRGDLWFPNYPGGVPQSPSGDQRKLLHTMFGHHDRRTSSLILICWGRADASGWDLNITHEKKAGEPDNPESYYGLGFIPHGSWQSLEFEIKLNTQGNSDGEYRLWQNGVLRYTMQNKQIYYPVNPPDDPAIYNSLYTMQTGSQEQWDIGEPVDMNDYRLWDNIQFWTRRP